MGRRVGIAVVVIVALLAGRVLVSRGAHPRTEERAASEAPTAPVVPSNATPSATVNAEPIAPSAVPTSVPAQENGVGDVDPHKAFGSKSADIAHFSASGQRQHIVVPKALFRPTGTTLPFWQSGPI